MTWNLACREPAVPLLARSPPSPAGLREGVAGFFG
jgi:hypothetical protein